MKSAQEAFEIIKSGTAQVIPEADLQKKLSSGKKLSIKLGMDPTAPDLHLGHAVVLNKMRQFQDLGHEVVFLIGDFTARIGDPTGKSKTRPPLTEAEIKKNAQTYFEQVSKILLPEKTIIRYNAEWLAPLMFDDVLKLAGKVTLARLIEREDFQKRLTEKVAIGFHELFYPILQGYDSVALRSDVELGGTDQTFNLLMGRTLQEQFGQEPQVIITMPILEGLDGVNKMSKSLGNYVGLWEDAAMAYGKLMSISDTLMWRYYVLLGNKTENDVVAMQNAVAQEKAHPMVLKKELVFSIIARFWSADDAQRAQQSFEAMFQRQDYSKVQEVSLLQKITSPIWIVDLLKMLNAVSSTSDAKRLIESGAVSLDEQIITNFRAEVALTAGVLVKVGKLKFYRIM